MLASTIRAFFFLLASFSILIWFFFLRDPLQLENYSPQLQPTFKPEEAKHQNQNGLNLSLGPPKEYEKIRLELERDLDNFTVTILDNKTSQLEQTQDILRTLKSHVWQLPQQDGYQEFRLRERALLGRIVQERIEALQDPANCSTARKLVCSVAHACGFGCIVHHIIFCLITAYSTNRTLILNLNQQYQGLSWNEIFLPLSNTCLNSSGFSYGTWGGSEIASSAQVLSVGTFETMDLKQPSWIALYPSGVPLEFASRLERVSNNPVMWWVGHFATYVLRPTQEVWTMLNQAKNRMNLSPFKNTDVTIINVGVQVRRTDKIISEAKWLPLERYMKEVEEYLAVKEKMKGYSVKAQVFLASDESKVIRQGRELERKANNSKWKIWANESIARDAENTYFRFNNGILPILVDVILLADCEFVVCTFSSNICRLVAELKEAKWDAKGKVVSLDDNFYFIAFR